MPGFFGLEVYNLLLVKRVLGVMATVEAVQGRRSVVVAAVRPLLVPQLSGRSRVPRRPGLPPRGC